MAWVLYGISLKNEMLPYSHIQLLNNCKQPDLESPCPLGFKRYMSTKFPQWGGGGGGGRVSRAGQRTKKRLVTYLLLKSWLSTIWKNWSTSRKNLSEQTQLRLGVEAGI